MACDDNLLVFCSEINNWTGCIERYALVVHLDLRDIEVKVYLNSRWFVGAFWEQAKMNWMHMQSLDENTSHPFNCNYAET